MTYPSSFSSRLGNTQHYSSLSSHLIDQVYSNSGYVVHQQTSLNLTPASSTPTYNQQVPISLSTPALGAEELLDNRFYVYLRSRFDTIFTSHSVVCIPHSSYLEDHHFTKPFIETHCFNSSPYYRGQYQSANGKVVSIEIPEKPILSTVSGFKQQRTIRIMSEEWVYIGKKKIRVFMIQGLLEGETIDDQKSRNKITIPTCRNSKNDLDFLRSFPENTESLVELQSAVKKFVGTYVYIRGFNNYTVDVIQHIYTKAYMTILQRNKLLCGACGIQAEYEHFLELVENVVMGLLHEKIWIRSLRSILQSKDNHIRSMCERYSNANITLQQYKVSDPISGIPLSCFDKAIACLRRTDTNTDTPTYITNNVNNATSINSSVSIDLAFTPLEKIACIKSTMDLISAAVDDYVKQDGNGLDHDGSYVTTDEMIPLLAYVIAHSQISRMASLIFYVEHFRLSQIEQPEHEFALATIRASVTFLEKDTLSLMKTSTADPTSPANSASPTVKLQNTRSKSTPSSSPPVNVSHNTLVHNHFLATDPYQFSSPQQTKASKPLYNLPPTSSSSITSSAGGLQHRKPPFANSPYASNEHKQPSPQRTQKQKQKSYPSSSSSSTTSSDSCIDDDYISMSNATTHHRRSHTPSSCSEIDVQSSQDSPQNADLLYDWIMNNNDPSSSFSDATTTATGPSQHQEAGQHRPHYSQQTTHHTKPATPPKRILLDTQPLISATIPTISNSTPLPNSPPTSSGTATSSQHQHQCARNEDFATSSKNKEKAVAVATRSEITSSATIPHHSCAATPEPTATFTPNSSWQFTLPALSGLLDYQSSLNGLDDANKKLDQSLSPKSNKASRSTGTTNNTSPQQPPKVITIASRLSFDSSVLGRRPASIYLDRRSSSSSSIGRARYSDTSQEDIGDFLLGLRNFDGDIMGGSSGQMFRMH